ncbi:MAG TPA: lysophospholipid acyltransferase family protein [Urbifossiella sp.]|nr:lysophospholipid acyltransferase family protein [Urbifossiella sp.]
MKIRNRHLVRAAGWLGAMAARSLVRTLSVRYHPIGPDVGDGRGQLSDRFIYSIWHENLLLPAARFGGPDLAVLISSHADGQVLGGLINAMGMTMVRGSSTRGGIEAVRQLIRPDVSWKHLAITTDGPRGPRRVVQPGAVYIASRTGMKLVPVGVGYHRPWRLKSWDRFAAPRPFSRARCLAGEPIFVPTNLRSAALEDYRRLLQAEMDRLNAAAEAWVETGRLQLPEPIPPVPLPLAG